VGTIELIGPCKMVFICWNRSGQQPVVVWGEESSMVAFIIDIDVLGGPVVHEWLIVESGHKMKQINAINYCLLQSNSI